MNNPPQTTTPLSTDWRRFLPIGLATLGAIVIAILVVSSSALPAWKQIALCIASVGGIAGVLLQPAPKTSPESSEQKSLFEQKSDFAELTKQTRDEFSQREQSLNQRERSLAERWSRHQEWFEYPDPLAGTQGQAFDPKLTEQDQQVLKILEDESKLVYEKLLANAYVKDGQADTAKIRDEVLALVTRIARVYSPEHQNPLLETSIEQLIRAANRTCLHLLVVLERLPLDVKSYNINSAYGYIQKAVSSYGAYKSAEPWLTFLGRTAYVGRFVAGANPVTLGAWWAATEIGKRGASTVMKNVIDQQAIGFLHDLIRVVGYEVAGIYSPDFRHRDANWIYATELTELLHHFPASRDNLSEALQQVAGLQLRNEYDRIYLYRCLASRKVASPQLSDPAMLDREDREQIVQRIEHFFKTHIHGQTEKKVFAWREQFEQRLDTRLKLVDSPGSEPQSKEIDGALQTVATFMQTICQLQPEVVDQAIRQTRLFKLLPDGERTAFIPRPSETFEAPDVEPNSNVADALLKDLATTTVRFQPTPSSKSPDESIDSTEFAEAIFIQTGHYFRVPNTEIQSLLESEYATALTEFLPESAPTARVTADVVRQIVSQVNQSRDRLLFVYPDATVDGVTGILVGSRHDEDGANETHMSILDPDTPATRRWSASKSFTARRIGRMIKDDCELSSDSDPRKVVIEGSFRGGRFHTYFEALLKECHFDSTE